jgi:hypothetical protein
MAAEKPPLASVGAVREELKRLGYLDRGLDRFVLAGAGGPSALSASLSVSRRVGVAGGILFGLTSALAAIGLDRRLLAEPQDLAVLTLYLALAFGTMSALAALLGGLTAARVGRRRGRRPGPGLARNVGLGLGLAGLLYLGLWWRSHLLSAPVLAQATALLLGLGLSLVLGRFGSLAAVAVLSAGGVTDRLPPASLSRQHLLPLLVGAAVFYGGGVAAAAYFGRGNGTSAPDYTVVPTGLRVRVLGIDGLERRMTEQLVGRGEMPHLRALLATAAQGRVRAEPERVPALVWTTIATGRGAAAHGIQSTDSRRIPGLRTPVSLDTTGNPFVSALGRATDLLRLTRAEPPTSGLRGIKTFWNVASEKGLRVGIVNWWATWPAESVNGYVVSDRAVFKLEKGGPPDREVYPPAAFDRVRALLPEEADRPRRLDRFSLAAAAALRGADPPDLEALYLPGLDIFTMQQIGESPGADLADLDTRLAAIRTYYRFLDDRIGEVAGDRGERDILVLVADPGRLARAHGPAEGTLAVVGGPVAATDLGLVSERDLAPTVLHLLGLPVSRELDGRVLEEVLAPGFRAQHPLRFVAAYGRRAAPQPAQSEFDQQMLEELRSLGYIR